MTEPFIRLEAVASCRIDGVSASLADLFFFEAAGEPQTERSDVRDVRNYAAAFELASEKSASELHRALLAGVRGARGAGEPSRLVPELPRDADLIALARFQQQFERAQPFASHNGRLARLLVARAQPLLYLSPYFERNRDAYAIDDDAFIDFFLHGVVEQAEETFTRAERLLAIADEYRKRTQSARNSESLVTLIDSLLGLPVTTAANVAAHFGVTYPAAKKTVDRLVSFGVLTPRDVGARHFYVAEEVLAALTA
jgi:hypothetical protein